MSNFIISKYKILRPFLELERMQKKKKNSVTGNHVFKFYKCTLWKSKKNVRKLIGLRL